MVVTQKFVIYDKSVKQFVVTFLFLLSFLSVRVAEAACICLESITTHSSFEKAGVSIDDQSSEHASNEKTEHCQHNCSQCHFTALVPLSFVISTIHGGPSVELPLIVQSYKDISSSVYRPPIA